MKEIKTAGLHLVVGDQFAALVNVTGQPGFLKIRNVIRLNELLTKGKVADLGPDSLEAKSIEYNSEQFVIIPIPLSFEIVDNLPYYKKYFMKTFYNYSDEEMKQAIKIVEYCENANHSQIGILIEFSSKFNISIPQARYLLHHVSKKREMENGNRTNNM